MKTLAEIRRMLAEHKAELRERFGVARLAVFGSYARGDATPLSDVDIWWPSNGLLAGKLWICAIIWKRCLGCR